MGEEIVPHRPDWFAIKQEYIQSKGQLTNQELADKHGVNVRALEKHVQRENWVELRAEFVAAMSQQVQQHAIQQRAEQLTSQANARVDSLNALFHDGVLRIKQADEGFPLQAASVSLGIITDKLHKELDRMGLAAPGTETERVRVTETTTTRDYVLERIRQGKPPEG